MQVLRTEDRGSACKHTDTHCLDHVEATINSGWEKGSHRKILLYEMDDVGGY